MGELGADRGGRRGFVARLMGVLGGGALGASALGAQSAPEGPLVHPEDAWLDGLGRGHRMVFDAYSTAGATNAGRYCGNWLYSNMQGYGLRKEQLGAVIVLRSSATVFAYGDAMWAKYAQIGQLAKLTDPTTSKPYAFNPYLRAPLPNGPTMGVQWTQLAEQGVHFAICNGTTTMVAEMIAGSGGAAAEAVRKELAANLIPNAHLMATGIVALGRAQEKGYTFGCGG